MWIAELGLRRRSRLPTDHITSCGIAVDLFYLVDQAFLFLSFLKPMIHDDVENPERGVLLLLVSQCG